MPYDVVQAGEVRDFIEQNPSSFLRVTRPEAEAGSNGSIERAKANFEQFIEDEILIPEAEESFYVYRLTSDGGSQTGVVGCCSLDEYDRGLIKKHERTRPDKVEDRMHHMAELRAQTGLIFLAYRGTDKIRAIIENVAEGEPLYDFTCMNGVRQTVWRAPAVGELAAAFDAVPSLYIADGHHRIESAAQARERLRKGNAEHDGSEDYNFVLAGMFPAEELEIMAYNRVVTDLNGLGDAEFVERIGERFMILEEPESKPQTHGEICMYLGGRWYDLRFKNGSKEDDPIERLDVSILQNNILSPILGITDPTTDERIGFVGGVRGTGELERMVDTGEARVAFSLYPTTMEDLLTVSDMGEIMPPKSTWFEPKLKDGLFVHLI